MLVGTLGVHLLFLRYSAWSLQEAYVFLCFWFSEVVCILTAKDTERRDRPSPHVNHRE